MADHTCTDHLRCHEAIEELREENAYLRRSANAFGELAERLNASLQEERRKSGERRRQPRNSPDRRAVARAVQPTLLD